MIRKKSVCRRHFTLLEIMIAFFIVSVCAIPLLAPNLWIIQEERNFSYQIEASRIANLITQKLLERLYDNKIPWQELNDKVEHPLPFDLKEGLNLPPGWPYSVSYSFSEKHQKPGKENSQTFHLFNLDLYFKTQDQKKGPHFTYEIFVERKLKSTAIEPTKLEEKKE